MIILGIVAEYNPFHRGHEHHLTTSKKILQPDCTVVVMSGSFTQRGEPAICDKFLRAEAAMAGGADLVLELPVLYVLNSAEKFAMGALTILKAVNITHLSFGMETPLSSEELYEIGETLLEIKQSESLKHAIKEGFSLKQAIGKTCNKIGMEKLNLLLEMPNNTLALEYIQSALALNFTPTLFPIARKGGPHHSLSYNPYPSGKYVREEICAGNWKRIEDLLPDKMKKNLRNYMECTKSFPSFENYIPLIGHMLLKGKDLSSIPGYEKGLESYLLKRFYVKRGKPSLDLEGTKRYTKSRLRRFLMASLLELPGDYRPIPYIRPLAFNDTGRQCLRRIKSHQFILTKTASALEKTPIDLKKILEYEIKATELYEMFGLGRFTLDFTESPHYMK